MDVGNLFAKITFYSIIEFTGKFMNVKAFCCKVMSQHMALKQGNNLKNILNVEKLFPQIKETNVTNPFAGNHNHYNRYSHKGESL